MKTKNRARRPGAISAAVLFCFITSPLAMAGKLVEQEFDLARHAIEEAQEVKAERVAGDELLMAEQKLQQAREYDDKGNETVARRLLEQSKLHAEYAEVQGLLAMSSTSLNELNETLNTLGRELGRP